MVVFVICSHHSQNRPAESLNKDLFCAHCFFIISVLHCFTILHCFNTVIGVDMNFLWVTTIWTIALISQPAWVARLTGIVGDDGPSFLTVDDRYGRFRSLLAPQSEPTCRVEQRTVVSHFSFVSMVARVAISSESPLVASAWVAQRFSYAHSPIVANHRLSWVAFAPVLRLSRSLKEPFAYSSMQKAVEFVPFWRSL